MVTSSLADLALALTLGVRRREHGHVAGVPAVGSDRGQQSQPLLQ
jgi:hypothetical protein